MAKNLKLLFFHLALTIFLSQVSYGQDIKNYSVSGMLKDFSNNQPIEFASVAIYRIPDTVLITGTITNGKGEFILKNLSSGKYVLKSSFVGYQTALLQVVISNASVSLSEPIFLTAAGLSLNEVLVTAARNEKQISIEKTKINVAQNISAVTGNVAEVLKSQSSVSFDGENNIYLRGNKNILILMDGVPTTISTLNSIPASHVEHIEIVTNPDAKYDAEGTGGIINIVTKRQIIFGLSSAAFLNFGVYGRINGGLRF